MATWLCTKGFLLAGPLLVALAPAFGDECKMANSTFFISHWDAAAPASIDVQVLDAANGKLRSTLPYAARVQASSRAGGQVLVLQPVGRADQLLASNNYKIVIDGRLEYVIHDIEMSNDYALGCPFKSAQINSCGLGQGDSFRFERSCGRSLGK